MSTSGKSGDPGKFYSLFGGPESYQTYGPGQADYITVPGPNQTGPLINIPLLMQEMGKPGASRGEIEGIFGKPPKKISPLPPKGRATAELAMAKTTNDNSRFYSLFGGPDSLESYGPGQPDYVTVRMKGKTGPLIDPFGMLYNMFEEGHSKRDIENLFRSNPKPPPVWNTPIPDSKRMKTDVAELDNGTRNDAMPQMPQQAVQGTKGDMQAPGDDPLSMISQAIMSLLSGGMPSPSMGGGTTEAPMGGSPFTQMPTQMDLPERNPFQQGGPDEEIMANAIRGPQMPAANQMQEMTQVPPMMQEAQKSNAAAAAPPPMPMNPEIPATPGARSLHPPVPTPNPSFHPDANSLEALLTSMFGQGQPQVPARNPLFSGGV